jgi:hypothetical protein
MRAYRRLGEALAATLLLLAPAMWNGFPFLQYDSGGYLARWFEGYLVPSRSTVYGLFAVAGWPLDFWPEVLLQAAAAVWIIWLVLRVYGLGDRPLALLGTVAALAATTSLPWIADILLTDIFAGTAVLALHLVLFTPAALSRRETAGLVLLIGFAAATHSATLAVLMAIVAVAGVARLYRRDLLPLAALGRGTGALALSVAMLLGTNFALSGQLAWTPGGYGIVVARMMQDGIVVRYLDAHCPDPRLRLCPYRHKLPPTADQFLWSDGPFNEIGRFDGLGDEMRTIVLESLAEYPGAQIETAISASARQLVKVESGERAQLRLAHLRHHRALHADGRTGNEGGAPAARRGELSRPQRGPGSGSADFDAAAAGRPAHRARRLRRFAATGRHYRGSAARQRRRMRRVVEPAQPLRREARLGRDVRRGAGADAIRGDAAVEDGGCAGINAVL